MSPKHLGIILIIMFVLIGSDLLIGFYGHYMGSREGDEFTWDAFFDYLANPNWGELLLVFLVAIVVFFLIVRLLPG